MDYYSTNQSQTQTTSSPFLTASAIFGVLALLSSITIFLPFVFGGLSILFAVLSHRHKEPLPTPALIGSITSVIGIVFASCILIVTILELPDMLRDEQYRAFLNETYKSINGITFDEQLEQNGIDLDALLNDEK